MKTIALHALIVCCFAVGLKGGVAPNQEDHHARREHLRDFDEDLSVEQQLSCTSCTSAVGVLQRMIRRDTPYEVLREFAVDVCNQLVPKEGWDPETLCGLAIDTYAPHVIYILNVTDKTPKKICTLYNNCPSLNSLPLQHAVLDGPGDQASGAIDRLAADERRAKKAAEWKATNYAGALRLVHISDIHTDYLYAEGSATSCSMPLCCRADYNGTGSALHWGDYACNIPHRTVDLMFSDIATRIRPHIVAYTGDSVQHTPWEQSLDETIEVDRFITERLGAWLSDSASYFTFGNHDACPTNLFYADRPGDQVLTKAVFDHWKPLSGFNEEQWATFSRGAYYSIEYAPGLRIVSYNSNYGSVENFYNILNIDEADYKNMKQFLENAFESARQKKEKIVLLGHHPTGSNNYLVDYEVFINDIQARYSDVIILHLLGHSHSDTFSLVRDYTSGETRGFQLSSPSMTSYKKINPSYRVIYLDPDTFEPLDMDTYHLDLKVNAGSANPEVKFVYRMSDEYGMTDMSSSSFDDLVNRMENDRSLMETYRYNVQTRVYQPGPCDDKCAANQLCNLRYSDDARLRQCYQSV